MNPTNKKLVLFDFDGVLVDTLNIYHTISSEVNPDLSIEEYKTFFEGNIYDSLRKDGNKTNRHPNFQERVQDYIREMVIPILLKDILINLSQNYILFIVSSTPSSDLKQILQRENSLEYFTGILGSDVHTSKVVKNKMILEKYGVSPENAVFITDTLGDIKEARQCGIESIAVTWGFHDRERLEKGNPSHIIDNPEDLIQAIENMLK